MFQINRDVSGAVIERKVSNKSNKKASYLSWGAAVAAAGVPMQHVALTDGVIERPFFGGAIVTVEQSVPGGTQRIHLPVMDGAFNAVPADRLTSRDVSDAVARCRGKAIAMCNGIGLGLYLGFGGHGPRFAQAMGEITSGSDLMTVAPYTKGKQSTPYVPWPAALAACMLTDHEFLWEVEECDTAWTRRWETIDTETGEVQPHAEQVSGKFPFLASGSGYTVGVTVQYHKRRYTEWLPIMGIRTVQTRRGPKDMDNQPLTDPSVMEWNKTVMRALTKAIAFVSGYGLALYAKAGNLPDLIADNDAAQAEVEHVEGPADPEPPVAAPGTAVARVRKLAMDTGTDEAKILAWIGVKEWSKARPEDLAKLTQVLTHRARKAA